MTREQLTLPNRGLARDPAEKKRMSIKPDGEQITSSFVLLLSSSLLPPCHRVSVRGILFFWLFLRCRTGGWRETRLGRRGASRAQLGYTGAQRSAAIAKPLSVEQTP